MQEVEKLEDARGKIMRTLMSLRFILSLLMLFMYSSGIITWKLSSDSATDAVNDLSNKLMTEIRQHIKTALEHHLDVAETVTLMNAGLFAEGSFSEADVPYFMQVFKTQLDAYKKSITTVSMTTKIGHLHGVYTDSVGIHKGYWSSNTSALGKVQLYDYNTTVPLPHEGIPDIPRMLYMEPDYNSSEQEWYTVCNANVPYDKAWTSIYTMGSQTPVTMLSESTVSYTKDGLMGVTTIDMALGFAGELLRNVQLPAGYKSFVVDVKNVVKFGGVQAIIGTADDTPLLYCRVSPIETFPMIGAVECSGAIEFVPVNQTQVSYIKKAHEFVIDAFGAWDFASGTSDTLSIDGDKHFITISTIPRKNLKWCVVILLPESVFLEEINKTKLGLLAMYVSVLVVKAFLSAMVVYFFIAPLHRLARELDLLAEFRIEEDAVVMSGWTEIRTLQLTFITLLKQMKVIKSYMPQALFIQEEDPEEASEQSIPTKSNGGRSSASCARSQSSYVAKVTHVAGPRIFDFKKHLTVMCIRVKYTCSDKEVDKLHAVHCQMIELISASAVSCKGTMDQISSNNFNIVWGRENFINLTNVTATVSSLLSRPLPGTITVGCAMGCGITGSAGGDNIRTIATLTDARAHAYELSNLAEYHVDPYLFTKRIRDQTEMTHKWEVCDVVKFDGAKQCEIVFIFGGSKTVNEDQEWLYQLDSGTVDKTGILLFQLASEIRACKVEDARQVITRMENADLTPERKTVLSHFQKIVENDCVPVRAFFSYERELLHGKSLAP